MQIGRKIKQWYYNFKYPITKINREKRNWEDILQYFESKITQQTLGEFSLKHAIRHDNGKFINFVEINPGKVRPIFLLEICYDNGVEIYDECLKIYNHNYESVLQIVDKINYYIYLLKAKHNVQT